MGKNTGVTGGGRVIGYARVSTEGQELENQIKALKDYARKTKFSISDIVTETISSRDKDRIIFKTVEGLSRGDTLLVYELSRIGRSMFEVVQLVSEIIKKGAALKVISPDKTFEKDNVETQCMLFGLGIGAQVERDLISERTKTALRAKKAGGVMLGRPAGGRKLEGKEKDITRYLENKVSVSAIARILKVSRATMENFIKEKNLKG